MRFMMMVKSSPDSEAGKLPSKEIVEAMGRYNQELVRAGVLLAAEGLQPSSSGFRVVYADGAAQVVDGPFAETKEMIAGFWLIQVKSREEAMQWALRVPSFGDGEAVELRQVYEPTDFPEELAREAWAFTETDVK
jgi:hypothetical protein